MGKRNKRNRKGRKRQVQASIQEAPSNQYRYESIVLLYRTDGDLSPNKKLLILCEGETEVAYFEGIKYNRALARQLKAIIIDCVIERPFDNSISGMVWEAMQRKRQADEKGDSFDGIWIVVDNDGRNAYKISQRTIQNVEHQLSSYQNKIEVEKIIGILEKHKGDFFINFNEYVKSIKRWFDESILTTMTPILLEYTERTTIFDNFFDATPTTLFSNIDLDDKFDYHWKTYVQIAYTGIAFENWLLLHFEPNKVSFKKANEVIQYLKATHASVYTKGNKVKKGKQNAYEILFEVGNDSDMTAYEKILTATENGAWLHHQQQRHITLQNGKYYEVNPYTTNHHLTKELLNLSFDIQWGELFETVDCQYFVLRMKNITPNGIELYLHNKTLSYLLINSTNFQQYFSIVQIVHHRRKVILPSGISKTIYLLAGEVAKFEVYFDWVEKEEYFFHVLLGGRKAIFLVKI